MRGKVCAVFGCSNYEVEKNARSFYRFPRDKNMCDLWVLKCHRSDLDKVYKKEGTLRLYKNYKICSDHFQASDFKNPRLYSQGLRKTNIPVKFVTNTTKESRRFLHERLVGLGFEIKPDEIWSSLWAARDLVASRELQPYLMLEDAAMEDFADLGKQEGEHEYNSVVIGLAPSMFDYDHLNKAFRLLLRGASLIAIHEARYYKRSDGLALGPGPFVKALEYAADCKSEVVGKPSPNFFKSALGDVDPKYAIMIGDDVRDDIGGAQKLGMQGILVQTGKYRPGDEDKISPPPCKVCPSFTHAVNMLLGELQKSE